MTMVDTEIPTTARPAITFGTFCSGIGAPEMAWSRLGWRSLFNSEIEPFPCAVLAHHYPHVPNLGDMNRVHAMLLHGGKRIRAGRATEELKQQHANLLSLLKSADTLAAGTPCQSFSVAGLRGGLSDPRGNLTLTFLNIVAMAKPRFVVWENVPGLLSDDGGKTFQKVLERFTQIGYVCDTDILDAQYFGVPQRRRRVFVTCVLLDDLLKKRTPISARIMGELLAQALLATWGALLAASSPGRLPSASESETELPSDFLRGKISSLNALLGGSAVEKLVAYFIDHQVPSTAEPSVSESTSTPRSGKRTPESKVDTAGCHLKSAGSECGGKNIASSWNARLDALLPDQNAHTTSTLTPSITDREICSFAGVVLDTLRFTVNSLGSLLPEPWSSDCWNLASLLSTLLKDVIKHARSTNDSLFIQNELRDSWRDHLDQSHGLVNQLERHLGNGPSSPEVLSLPDRMRWNPAPSRAAGKGFTHAVAPSITASGRGTERTGESRGQDAVVAVGGVAGTLGSNHGNVKAEHAWTGQLVTAHSLRAEGFDASEDGTGRRTPLVPVGYLSARAIRNSDSANEVGIKDGMTSDTLQSDGPGAIAYTIHGTDKTVSVATESEVSTALRSRAPGQVENSSTTVVATFDARNITSKENRSRVSASEPVHTLHSDPPRLIGSGVRRLTPAECEKLQGFPPGFTAIPHRGKSAADGPRYKSLGNSMATDVVEWIGERITLVDAIPAETAGAA